MTAWPAASTPWTWKTDLAISRPIVVIVCMAHSSESWKPELLPQLWHSRAGGGAVHSIKLGSGGACQSGLFYPQQHTFAARANTSVWCPQAEVRECLPPCIV